MPKPECLANIQKKQPPTPCTDPFCARIQPRIDEYCHAVGYIGEVPVPEYEDGVGDCWCCCSCFAYNTPIAVAQGTYEFIQDIAEHDMVLVTGPDVQTWVQKEVTESTGTGPETQVDFMFYITYQHMDGGTQDTRYMIVTADHLFLMASGKLKAVQYLIPGDQIRQSNGEVASVVFAVAGQYKGGVHHISVGHFNGTDLNGHLVDANGIVSSDYSVQLYYATNNIPEDVLEPLVTNVLSVGSNQYHARFPSVEAEQFLADRKAWPKGFQPHSRELINVPDTAMRFVTDEQAAEIQANAPMAGYGNGDDLQTVRYLFKLFNAMYPGIIYLVDWSNDVPNAYAWEDWGDKYILVTGGLARVETLQRDGLSLVLSHLESYHNGVVCVGPADYNSMYLYMRQVWNGNLFFSVSSAALEQVRTLFSYITTTGEDPSDICHQPSIDCRLLTMQEGKAMGELPDCANPDRLGLEVTGASVTRFRHKVKVDFNLKLDPPTAGTIENYSFEPPVTVTAAVVNGKTGKQVVLDVTGLEPKTTYTVKVQNVTSETGIVVDPEHNTASFTTV